MNTRHELGKSVSSLELYDEVGPVTGVRLLVDDENEIFSGDETGYVLEMECPYATQDMADNILAKSVGQTYTGYRAQDAQLGIDSELGDGVAVDDIYSVLAYQLVSFGPGHVSEIAAPGENTVDHEYPYLSPVQRQIQRNRAEAYSMISKNAEEIELLVSSLEGYSTIEQTAESISASVHGALYVATETDVLALQELAFTVNAGTGTATTEDNPYFASYGPYYVEWDGVEYCIENIYVDANVSETSDWDSVSLTQEDVFSIEKMTDNLTGTVTCTITALNSTETTHTVRIFTRSDTEETEKYSTVKQTASSISAAVSGLVDETTCQSMIDMSLDGITMEVSDSEGSSKFVLKSGTTELWSDTFDLHVKAVNVEGTLTADKIEAGAITASHIATGVIPTKLSDLTDDSNFVTPSGVASIIDGHVTADYVNAFDITATNLRGKKVYLYGEDESEVGAISLIKTDTYAFDITSELSVRINAAANYNAAVLVNNGLGFIAYGKEGYCKVVGGPLAVSAHSYGALADRPETGEVGQIYFATS